MTKAWWKAAGIRAIKTMAQTAVAMIGTSIALTDVDWKLVVSATVLAGILSLLTSLAGLPEVTDVSDEDLIAEGDPVGDDVGEADVDEEEEAG